MQAHEAIARFLYEEGIDTVFTLMSEEIIPLLSHVDEAFGEDVRLVTTRHEQGAAAMADGYARLTDGIGVCIVGRGPAIAQTGTSLLTARSNESPVLYLVPETSLTATYDDKEFRQETYLETTVGEVVSIRSSETLSAEMREAIRRLRLGDGPIAIQIPEDLLNSAVESGIEPTDSAAIGQPGGAARLHPDESKLRAAVELYLDSDATRPPVILAGRGSVRAAAKDELEALAERINAFLATTLQARGYFASHPYSVGFTGDLGSPLANEQLTTADFVLAVGCSLNPHTHDSGNLVRDEAKTVHVDTDPTSIGRYLDVDLAIHGDARTTISAFTRELEAEGIDRRGEFWTDANRERIASSSDVSDRDESVRDGRMDPRELVGRLDELLPRDRLVVTDAGHFATFVIDGITVRHPDDFVWTLDFTAVGQGLSIGIGAALAATDRDCITFCGDAGFMMALQEVETAARHDVPITIVVMNDTTLGAEYHQAGNAGYSGDVAVIDTPDLAAVAEGLGAIGHSIRSASDLDAARDRLESDVSRPVVLDCRLDRDVRHRLYGG